MGQRGQSDTPPETVKLTVSLDLEFRVVRGDRPEPFHEATALKEVIFQLLTYQSRFRACAGNAEYRLENYRVTETPPRTK